MRILWVNHRCPRHPEAGGAEVHLTEVCKRLVERGCEVTLLSERFHGSPRDENVDGIRVKRSGGKFQVHLRSLIQVAQLARRNDVVVDDIAHGIPWWSGLVTRKPVIGVIHHVHQSITRVELCRPLGLATRLAERTVRFAYDRIITVSEASKIQVETELGVDPSRIRVVYHGVDHEMFKPSGEKFGEPTLLWLGRIKRYKNLEDLLSAFAWAQRSVPNLRLVVAGEGNHRLCLEESVRKHDLKHVTFLGRVSVEDKVKLLQRSWALCLTSFIEGWGLVLTEASACGLPAISYDSGGPREAVVDGRTGFLVEQGNVRSLGERIVQIALDSRLRGSLSTGALEYSRRFDWEKTTDDTLRILSEACYN